MLSVIACASPSITGLFSSRFLCSLQSQTCSLFCGETFLKSLWQVFFFSFFFFFKLNESIHNKLSRKRLRGGAGGGGKKHHLCQAGKQSRQIAPSCQKSVTPLKTRRSHPGKMKNISLTQNTAFSTNSSFLTLLQLNLHFCNLCFQDAATITFLGNWLTACRLMDALTSSLVVMFLSEH